MLLASPFMLNLRIKHTHPDQRRPIFDEDDAIRAYSDMTTDTALCPACDPLMSHPHL